MTSLNIKKHENRGAELLVQGVVQGVGFRPFVYNLAKRLHISGTVTNTSVGVFIQASASKEKQLASFIHQLKNEAPPLARITSIDVHPVAEEITTSGFSIIESVVTNSTSAIIPPDIALCPDCARELTDPGDHRYQYPFINCTNCGPRFTIVEEIPYDRPKTSMRLFPMCSHCEEEYNDPANRRFHAQPNACKLCGPELSYHSSSGKRISTTDPIDAAIADINDNKIVAIRGLGGFHLCVNGCSEKGVGLLREKKKRKSKPLAIMVANLAAVKAICHLSPLEEKVLQSPEHPILLMPKKATALLAPNLAPDVGDIGIMLPYTPFHELLFQHPRCPRALVMTSGNISGEPICTSNEQALDELADIADAFLLHNREIVTRIDDSVGKKMQGEIRSMRRSRGYVPGPLLLPYSLPPLLSCGAGLKNTFCLTRDTYAFPSQHIGDLFSTKNYDFFTESINHMKKVLEIEPVAVACDLHPDYLSTLYAQESNLPLYRVQHHHAHAVAVMVENDLDEEVLAIVLDGTGYGDDGTIWGGEILRADLTGFQRLGHLEHLQLPGGDAAASEPWRMGLSSLYHTYGPEGLQKEYLPPLLKNIPENQRHIVTKMLEQGFNSPNSSSCGRLFDGIAALLDLQSHTEFEGQAAMKLEALARKEIDEQWKSRLLELYQNPAGSSHKEKDGQFEINTRRFVTMIIDALPKNHSKSNLALHFHLEFINSVCRLTSSLARKTGIRKVVLSGGCMQNQILLEGFFHVLEKSNFKVYTGADIPVNDGGISLGQAIIGGLQHVSRNTHAGN